MPSSWQIGSPVPVGVWSTSPEQVGYQIETCGKSSFIQSLFELQDVLSTSDSLSQPNMVKEINKQVIKAARMGRVLKVKSGQYLSVIDLSYD